MSKKVFFTSAVLVLALGILTEAGRWRQVGRQLIAEKRQLAALEVQSQKALEQLAGSLETQLVAVQKLVGIKSQALAKADEEDFAKILWARIRTLRRILEETPAENIPELKMLGMKDWINAVLSVEARTGGQIKILFFSLRSKALNQFAEKLHVALQRFTEASNGELPTSLSDLVPYLEAPADSSMLARYALRRSGKIVARDEELIGLKSPEDGTSVSVNLAGYKVTSDPDFVPKMSDSVNWWSETFNNGGSPTDEPSQLEALQTAEKVIGPFVEKSFAALDNDKEFGERLKAAVQKLADANHGKPPADLLELRPSFPEVDRIGETVRPVFAQLAYLMDHDGKASEDLDTMQHYLEKPDALIHTLRATKLSVVDGEVSIHLELP